MTKPDETTARAAALKAAADAALSKPAALFLPADVRALIREACALIETLAARR